jgi:hypothetical protein
VFILSDTNPSQNIVIDSGEGGGHGPVGGTQIMYIGSASGKGFQNWERCEPVRGGQGGLGLRCGGLSVNISWPATC